MIFVISPRRRASLHIRGGESYFALDGTDHLSHKEQGNMIRRAIIWRNKHAQDERLRSVVNRANVA